MHLIGGIFLVVVVVGEHINYIDYMEDRVKNNAALQQNESLSNVIDIVNNVSKQLTQQLQNIVIEDKQSMNVNLYYFHVNIKFTKKMIFYCRFQRRHSRIRSVV